MDQIITNSTVNGILQSLFALLVIVVVINAIFVVARALREGGLPTTEEPAVPSELVEPAGLFPTVAEKLAMAEHRKLVGAGPGSDR